ncbi:hypothetical protein NL676_016975 [Syzygium grande]|nr:hypothetical protein NL676_016975 [Syzygium grande]
MKVCFTTKPTPSFTKVNKSNPSQDAVSADRKKGKKKKHGFFTDHRLPARDRDSPGGAMRWALGRFGSAEPRPHRLGSWGARSPLYIPTHLLPLYHARLAVRPDPTQTKSIAPPLSSLGDISPPFKIGSC